MSSLLLLLTGTKGIFALLGAAILAAIAAWLKRNGAKEERARQAAAEIEARATADKIRNEVGAMSPDEAREELKRW